MSNPNEKFDSAPRSSQEQLFKVESAVIVEPAEGFDSFDKDFGAVPTFDPEALEALKNQIEQEGKENQNPD